MTRSISRCRWAVEAITTTGSFAASVEIEQSMKIVEQALANLPVGPVWIEDPRFVLPEKEKFTAASKG